MKVLMWRELESAQGFQDQIIILKYKSNKAIWNVAEWLQSKG